MPASIKRPQQRNRAGRIAARIGDALGCADRVGLFGVEFGEAVNPTLGDAMRGRGIDDFRRVVAEAIGQRHGFLRRIVRQAQHDGIDVAHHRQRAPPCPCAASDRCF